MPDLFDNLYNKISTSLNGGRSTHHYSNASRVNTGRFYSYHENSTNNKYWLPINKDMQKAADHIQDTKTVKPRMGSVSSMNSESDSEDRSRMGSVSSEMLTK